MIQYLKKLKVWKKSKTFASKTYKVCSSFPKEEQFGLIIQMKRCSVSIPSNIAEGSARDSVKEFIHFLNISLGSSYELETQLEIAFDLKFLSTEIYNEVLIEIQEIQNMIIGLKRFPIKNGGLK